MTPEQREKLMDEWERAREILSNAEDEYECDRTDEECKEAFEEAEHNFVNIDMLFPECRLWPWRTTPQTIEMRAIRQQIMSAASDT